MQHYNPVGPKPVIPIPVPTPVLYATRVSCRKPEVKYQTPGNAKSAVRHKLVKRTKQNFVEGRIVVYKFNQLVNDWEPIFTYDSDLAQAFKDQVITADELMKAIDW